MKKLYLVDVSNMFFRAYYAVRMLTNAEGLPTNAIYGFLSMSIKLLKEVQPDYMAYCYDRPEASFRKDIDPNYKANRGETPEDLIPQIPYIKKVTDLLGIPAFEKEKYEADDIIGSLADFGFKNKVEVVIVSGDKDFAQLVNDKISMYDTMRDNKYDYQGVIDKWGVKPEQFIDYLAITGDTSDNIPGIKGVGPKGAQKLIAQFGDLDGIYKNLKLIKSEKQRQKIEDAKDNAYLSKELVTIVKDLELVKDLKDLSLKPIDKEAMGELLDELNFKTFKKNLVGGGSESKEKATSTPKKGKPAKKTSAITTKKVDEKGLESWLEKGDELWAWKDSRAFYLCKGSEAVEVDGDLKKIGQILDKKKIGWKGFDLKSLWRELGICSANLKWDHTLSAYLAKTGSIKNFRDIYQLYSGGTLPEFPEPSDIFPAQIELEEDLSEKLKGQKMMPILQTLDAPLVEVLCRMESKGVKIDSDFLAKESKELEAGILELEKQIHYEAGEEFNVASPKQLGQILFEKMGLPKGKKTKTGYSTATDVLEKLVDEFPICKNVLEFRELSKLKSTYVDSLPQLINEETGRVHTVFNPTLTVTGRLSSNNPNLQNIPIRTERGRRVRQAFIAEGNNVLLSADYSQIELRVLAHIAKAEGLKEAFQQDMDIHSFTAHEIFDIPLDDVTSEHRRKAKAVNFGIAYGQGVFGLAESLKIERSEAKEIIANYFKKYPGVSQYMESIVAEAKEKTYVETLFGRRRYIPELFAKGPQRAFGERAAINAPIQGTASDLVKMAMLELFDDYPKEMLLQVHDELLFELPKKGIEEHAEHIKSVMENCVSLDVPLKVNVSWGKNWAEAH